VSVLIRVLSECGLSDGRPSDQTLSHLPGHLSRKQVVESMVGGDQKLAVVPASLGYGPGGISLPQVGE